MPLLEAGVALALWKDIKEPILLDGAPELPVFEDGGLLWTRALAGKLDSEQPSQGLFD